jgi:hypothetical protein
MVCASFEQVRSVIIAICVTKQSSLQSQLALIISLLCTACRGKMVIPSKMFKVRTLYFFYIVMKKTAKIHFSVCFGIKLSKQLLHTTSTQFIINVQEVIFNVGPSTVQQTMLLLCNDQECHTPCGAQSYINKSTLHMTGGGQSRFPI